MKRLKKELKKLDLQLIQTPAKYSRVLEKVELMHNNLWGQFGFSKDDERKLKMNPKEFSWTEKIKKEFYEVPFHKQLMKGFIKFKIIKDWEKTTPAVSTK